MYSSVSMAPYKCFWRYYVVALSICLPLTFPLRIGQCNVKPGLGDLVVFIGLVVTLAGERSVRRLMLGPLLPYVGATVLATASVFGPGT